MLHVPRTPLDSMRMAPVVLPIRVVVESVLVDVMLTSSFGSDVKLHSWPALSATEQPANVSDARVVAPEVTIVNTD